MAQVISWKSHTTSSGWWCLYSSCSTVSSGFPQGSVLGPVLFLLYINDITTNINSQLHLFADDCLIFLIVTSPAGHQILQDDLDTLTAWSRTWQMEFNISKCKTLQVSTTVPKASILPDVQHSFRNCWAVPDHYLGVCLHHRMSWQPHIDFICNKANCLLGFLHRNLRLCPSKLKENTYK